MPSKPTGSRIDEFDEVEGVTYQWDCPDPTFLRWCVSGITVIQFGVIFGVVIPEMFQQAQRQGPFPVEIIICFGLFALISAVPLYFGLRKGLPERVTLGRDLFRYDPGLQCSLSYWFNPWFMMKYNDPSEAFARLFRRRKVIELAKNEFGRVVLDRAGERQRLYFDHCADRGEMGESLREPEREWLATVIQQWQDSI